jgi:hypothetical protein
MRLAVIVVSFVKCGCLSHAIARTHQYVFGAKNYLTAGGDIIQTFVLN